MSDVPQNSPHPAVPEIVEVGARDGLQNEKVHFTTAQKINLINKAIDSGIRRLEVASFVHPKLVPQMADAEAVIQGLEDRPDVTYIGLALNKRGVLRGIATKEGGARGIDEIGCVAVASDTFGQKNQGQTREETIQTSKEMIRLCQDAGLSAQVTISTAWGCPFEGRIDQQIVVDTAKRLAEANPREIAIADTIGVASPVRVTELISKVKEAVPHIPLRAHFHNTRNTGIANAYAAWQAGATILDSSIAGLGGCPFAPKATGNIATEDLIYMLDECDLPTGIDLTALIDASQWVETILGRTPPAMVSQAGGFPTPQ